MKTSIKVLNVRHGRVRLKTVDKSFVLKAGDQVEFEIKEKDDDYVRDRSRDDWRIPGHGGLLAALDYFDELDQEEEQETEAVLRQPL